MSSSPPGKRLLRIENNAGTVPVESYPSHRQPGEGRVLGVPAELVLLQLEELLGQAGQGLGCRGVVVRVLKQKK